MNGEPRNSVVALMREQGNPASSKVGTAIKAPNAADRPEITGKIEGLQMRMFAAAAR
jgi:hypothetical protein